MTTIYGPYGRYFVYLIQISLDISPQQSAVLPVWRELVYLVCSVFNKYEKTYRIKTCKSIQCWTKSLPKLISWIPSSPWIPFKCILVKPLHVCNVRWILICYVKLDRTSSGFQTTRGRLIVNWQGMSWSELAHWWPILQWVISLFSIFANCIRRQIIFVNTVVVQWPRVSFYYGKNGVTTRYGWASW